MKLKELLEVLERALKDSSPKMSFYGEALRIHMNRSHGDLMDEEVIL